MMVLDTHVWIRWVDPTNFIATTITANAALASLDDAFSQYAELSGKLFSR